MLEVLSKPLDAVYSWLQAEVVLPGDTVMSEVYYGNTHEGVRALNTLYIPGIILLMKYKND